MSHDLSMNNNGSAELVLGNNTSAWHSLGTVFPGLVSKEQAIAVAMPWQAIPFEMLIPSKQILEKTGIQITTNKTGRYAILRSDTAKTIGFVGEGYEILQPSKMFDFCEGVNVPGYETAGALKGGSVLFLCAHIGEINVLNSGDITRTYLTMLNSFDGSIAAQVYLSGVRIVCRNTMNMSLSAQNGKTLKFRHTKSLHDRMQQAQQIMQASQVTEESLKVALETLATRKLKKQTYEDILSDLFPGEHTRTKNVKVEISELYQDNDNNAFPDFKGTAYNLYNAITNYSDHTRDIRITKASATEDTTLQRYESALIGTGAELKMRALERILVLSDGSEVVESNPTVSLPPRNITPKYLSTVKDSTEDSPIDLEPSDFTKLSDTPESYFDDSSYDHREDISHDLSGEPTSSPMPDDSSEVKPVTKTAQRASRAVKKPTVHNTESSVALFTTALPKYDLSTTKEESIVETVSDSVKVRRVLVTESTVDTQTEIYTREGFFTANEEKWSKIQSDKAKK